MPITADTTLAITCDNASCPNQPPALTPAKYQNGLAATDRKGWVVVTYEIYGAPTMSHVFCSATCAAQFATNAEAEVTATQKKLTGAP